MTTDRTFIAPQRDLPPAPGSRRLWLTLLVVLLADAMDLIDATITNVAAPSIVADLGAGESLLKWLSAAYALALGSLLVVGGRLGDRYGQRRTFLAGMAGFVLASAAAGLAVGSTTLVAARAAQGACGALLIPQGMAIMTATFPKPVLQKAFASFAPMLGLFAVGGPILGGVLIDADLFGLGWRPIFLINLVLGGGVLVLAARFLPFVPPQRSVRIDVRGSALLAGSLFAVLYGLIEGSSDGWGAAAIGTMVLGGGLFAAFAVRQGHTEQPLLARSLLADRGFVSGLVVGLLAFISFSGLAYVISLYFQLVLGYSPTRTALGLIPLTAGIIVGSGVSTALLGRLGRALVGIGLLTTMAGIGCLLVVVHGAGDGLPWWQSALATLVVGAGAGIEFSSIFATALGDIEPHEAGGASGAVNAIQQLANGVGSAVVASVFVAFLGDGGGHAMTVTLVVILGVVLACCAALPLLPRRAAALPD